MDAAIISASDTKTMPTSLTEASNKTSVNGSDILARLLNNKKGIDGKNFKPANDDMENFSAMLHLHLSNADFFFANLEGIAQCANDMLDLVRLYNGGEPATKSDNFTLDESGQDNRKERN